MTRIKEIEASAYTFPTDGPEADGTFNWTDTTMVLVQVYADDVVGTGWTYGSMSTAALIRQTLAPLLTGRRVEEHPRLWQEMLVALRNIGRSGIGAMALSATDCALWDLRARSLETPLHHLLGEIHETVPVYGSGGFTTYDDARLATQLQCWIELGISRVKIKIGESWGTREDRDLQRVGQAREVIGSEAELYVDANGAYRASQAVRLAAELEQLGVTWFEEPVSSDDISGLRYVRERCRADVAAGEYGYSLNDFQRLCAASAVDCVQVDVTRCGGITELLRIAALAAAHHLEVSGHCAPYLHRDALAAVPNLRHLEWFHDHTRIEQRCFAGATDPVDGSLGLTDEPGNGLTFRAQDISGFRVF